MGIQDVIEEHRRLSGIEEETRHGTDWLDREDLVALQKKVGTIIRAIKKALPDIEDDLDNADDVLNDKLGRLYKPDPLSPKEASKAFNALHEVIRHLTSASGKFASLCAGPSKINAAIGEIEAVQVALNNMTKER